MEVQKLNNTYMLISAERYTISDLYDFFSFYAPNFQFMPAYKNHIWDGKIRFFNAKNRTLPIGLFNELKTFCENTGEDLIVSDDVLECFKSGYTREEFVEELKQLDLSAYGEKIELRDYQMLGIYSALKNKRRVFVSNTSSGKSAIIYGISRLLSDKIEGKQLIIVPSTSLVEQMYNDFTDYSSDDDNWDIESHCCKVYSGHKYDPEKNIVISTWQSLQRKEPEFFEQFSGVICDESHNVKSVQISKILIQCINADYRFGFTGTLPKEETDRMTIKSYIGEPQTLSTTKQAIERGFVSKLNIECKMLRHQYQREMKDFRYMDEVDFLCYCDERNDYICDLAKNLEGNTIILTSRVDSHGKVLYNKLVDDSNGKDVFEIFGEVKTEERERIRQQLEKESNCIVVGNYQILSTGWSVRNVHNLIFAFPTKSYIRVVQSVGRVLRKSDTKDYATVYDIADAFVKDGKDIVDAKNYSFGHFRERLNFYAEEQHQYNIEEVKLD